MMLTKYQLKITDDYDISIDNVKKMVPNFFNKRQHALHYKNLQLYLTLGSKIKEVHRVFEFDQSKRLKRYIEFNTQKGREAEKNYKKHGKTFSKLMDNAVYGKTTNNLRNRVDVRLVNNKQDYFKCIAHAS